MNWIKVLPAAGLPEGERQVVKVQDHSIDVKVWSPWPPGVGKMLGAVAREKALRVFPARIAEGSVWIGLD